MVLDASTSRGDYYILRQYYILRRKTTHDCVIEKTDDFVSNAYIERYIGLLCLSLPVVPLDSRGLSRINIRACVRACVCNIR